MPVRYIGDTTWAQSELPSWSIDGWGMDHATIPYRGRADQKKQFEDSLSRWSSMPGFANMRLSNWTSNPKTPSFPEVQLNYIGFRSGVIPPVKSIDSIVTGQAQGSATVVVAGVSKQVSGSFLYRCSRTTWIWFETSEPSQNARYYQVRNAINPFTGIYYYSLTDDSTGKPINSIGLSALGAVFNSLRAQYIVSNYERELLIPGMLWGCRAEVDWRLQ